MKKYVIFSVIFLLLIVPANVFAEDVPDWVKNVSEWWSQGSISESEFLNAIKYLVEHNIISIESDDEDNLLLDAGLAENAWKTKHFSTLIELHGDLVLLLADTAEIQTLVKFSEFSGTGGINLSEEFLKENVMKRFLEFTQIGDNIDQVRILDKTGMEVIRINNIDGTFVLIPDNELQDKSDRYYFHEALKLQPNNVYRSHIDLNVENGEIQVPHKPTLRIATPIHDSNNDKLGFLIINYLMKPNLDEYTQSEFCNVSVFDEDGIVIASYDETQLFGNQLETGYNFYDSHLEFEEIEEHDLDWHYDKLHDVTIILDETDSHGSDRYWHFVCELK